MLHKVVVPFPFSWDGIHAVDLVIGDERDFGPMVAGLIGMGWIEPIEESQVEMAVTAKPIGMAVIDEPIEMAVVKRGRKRK